ncbi:MAG TPA: class I SAM-dependent methyltransferase [Solirubrobacteraceae bacterium]|jgi:trans-aconitate 2-methyltransferase|nr:class I SAM-dependent methyltransferase [Solirubrobacteraceae bacterium]
MSETRDWDGSTYDRISAPQHAWGKEVLERLPLQGDETVLDAGCGSGRVTEMLAERLPRGRVIAVDASPSMVDAARERLGALKGTGVRVDVRVMDLEALQLEAPLDAILSTATFHWIGDHERLFAHLRAALRPGGHLVAQCGGEGNVRGTREAAQEVSAREPFEPYMRGWDGPWNFSSAELAEERLRAAGFKEARCWLHDVEVYPPEPREFLRTVNLGSHLLRLPEELREPFVDAVHEIVGEPYRIDYVRLNIEAVA